MAVILREYLQEIETVTLDLKENLKSNHELSDSERKETEAALETLALAENVTRNMMGDYSKGAINLKEALASTDAIKLFPKVIEGKLREAMEPAYLGVNFFDHINVSEEGTGTVYQIPVAGEIYAREVAEMGYYNEQNVDFTALEQKPLEIRVRKVGVRVTISEEAIKDSSWDILGINANKMGRALSRYKEEMAFNNFTTHGHTIFDNTIRDELPEAGTTGRNASGDFNDTLTLEDLIEMYLAMMENDRLPTNIIMHPLTWLVFAKNQTIGNGVTVGAFGGNNVHHWGANQGTPGFAGLAGDASSNTKIILRPEDIQNRLPMPIAIDLSPFVRFDKVNKDFDMYTIDKTYVGCIIQKEGITTGSWVDPERDIKNLKCRERYGMGIYGNGEGIMVAKHIAAAPTYPVPPKIEIYNKTV